MKVLFLTNCPSPYRVSFFNELSKYVKLTVLFEMRHAKNRSDQWKSDEKYNFEAIYLKSWFQKQESAFCPEVVKYINKFKRDIIIVGGYSTPTGMYSIIYMNSCHIPFILNSDGGMIKQDSFLRLRVKNYFISSATYWLSTGINCSEYLEHYGADRNRIFEYPFSSIRQDEIQLVSFDEKKMLRESLGIEEKKVVLFVGSFIDRKGLDILLAACKDLVGVAIVLVGGDDITRFLTEDDQNFGCHLYIEGFKTEHEIKKYYQAADIFVLPTREDIWGLVVNEAMSVGLPVITTDHCGAGLVLIKNGENGYLVPINSAEALTSKLVSLLNDDVLISYMGRQNIKQIRQYTIEEMAKVHVRIIEEIENNGML